LEVNKNGKEEKGSDYACDTTEDRSSAYPGSFSGSPGTCNSDFYSSGVIYATEVSMRELFLSMGWLRFRLVSSHTLFLMLRGEDEFKCDRGN